MTPFTWNADREKLTPTQFRSAIGGGWRNYIKRGYVWQPISALIAGDLSCTTFPGNVQFAADSQGWSDIVIDGTFSMARHIAERNGHNAEPELRLSMQVECDHNVAGEVDENKPWQVVYRGAWDCADLRLGIWQGKAARIEKVIDFHSMPDGDSEFVEHSFLIRSSHARVFAGPNLNVSPWQNGQAELFDAQAFVARADSQLRGVLLKAPVAWYYTADGTEVRTPIRVTFEIQDDGETVRCTKHIPRALIATALSNGSHLKADATFSPDASPETSSVDGSVGRLSTESWSALRAGSGTASDDSNSSLLKLQITLDGSGNGWGVDRPIILLDTSSIGSGNQVDSGTLQLDYGIQSDGASLSSNFTAALVGSSPASNTSIADSDYQTVNSTEMATGRHAYGTTGLRSFTLNAAGIANIPVDGVAKFGIREGYYDLDGNSPSGTPGGYTRYHPRPAEYTGTASDPLLTVVTSAASSFGAWYAAANPSGY